MRVQICYVDAEDHGCEDAEVYTETPEVHDWYKAAEHAISLEDDDYVVLRIALIPD